MENINELRKQLNLRDKREQAQKPIGQRKYYSMNQRNKRYNKAVEAMRRYNSNMQDYATRTRGMYTKHLQVPQGVYMGLNNG